MTDNMTSNLDAFRDRIDAYFGPRKEGVLKTPYFLHETEWIELRKAFVAPSETTNGWKRLHSAVASWSANPPCGPTRRIDLTSLNRILADNNPFDRSPEEPTDDRSNNT